MEPNLLTPKEREELQTLRVRLNQLKGFLNTTNIPEVEATSFSWYEYLATIKVIVGNASNGMSFIGCLSAKHYLCQHLPMMDYDAAAKPQGAPGLDIDERTTDGKRVVGEVKTTMPYKQNDFGAQQIISFRRDFAKLNAALAEYKYLFVTAEQAFSILKRKYAHLIPDVKIVLLNIEGQE